MPYSVFPLPFPGLARNIVDRPHIKMLTCFVPWGTVLDRTLLVLTKRPVYSESTL